MRSRNTFVSLILFGISTALLLSQVRSGEDLQTLFEELKSSDLEVKNRASQGLLSYAKVWIRQDAATMQQVLPTVLAALGDSYPDVGVQASAFFGVIGMFRQKDALEILRPVTDQLIARFDDPNPRVRENLMRAFALAQPAPPYQAVDGFMKHLKDSDDMVRRLAVYGLVKAAPASLPAAEAVAGLLDETADSEARRELVRVLGKAKLTHPVIIAKLIEQLDRKDERLREDTVYALGEIGPPAAPAIDKLRAIAGDPASGESLRKGAERAIRSIEKDAPAERPR